MAKRSSLILLLALFAATACHSPKTDYDDYLARRHTDGGDEQVVMSTLQNLSGKWFLHALLAGGLDLGLRCAITMDPTVGTAPFPLHAKLWLAASNPDVDPPVVETDSLVNADGTFMLNADPLVLAAGTTPGLNVSVTASVLMAVSTQSATAWCGTATGSVAQPLSIDLKGSTFAARPDDGTITIADVPQSCFPSNRDMGMTIVQTPRPTAPDLSSVSSVVADISGNWILTANLAGAVPLQLWADLTFTAGTPDGGTTFGSLDGVLRRATDPPGSLALASFNTQVDSQGRFEVWLPDLEVGTVQAAVLLVGATRDMNNFCGLGAGTVYRPLSLDLDKTTFGAVRWTPGTPLPNPAPNKCN